MQTMQKTQLYSYENFSSENSKKEDLKPTSLKKLKTKEKLSEDLNAEDNKITSGPLSFEKNFFSKNDFENPNKNNLKAFNIIQDQNQQVSKLACEREKAQKKQESMFEQKEETFTNEKFQMEDYLQKKKKRKRNFSNEKLKVKKRKIKKASLIFASRKSRNTKYKKLEKINYFNDYENYSVKNKKEINLLTENDNKYYNYNNHNNYKNLNNNSNLNININFNFASNNKSSIQNQKKLISENPENENNKIYKINKVENKKIEINLENKTMIKKRKYTKSKDISASEQKYSCKICGKIYISYPAFYTHKRNRHNIISITNRHDLVTGVSCAEGAPVKYDYNSIGFGKTVNFEFSDFLLTTMLSTLDKIYCSENSPFYCSGAFHAPEHIFILYLRKYKLLFAEKIEIPSKHLNLSIDEILIVYFILFAKVTNEDKLIELAAAFIVYLREYLNIHGFDYYAYFMKFELFENLSAYCLVDESNLIVCNNFNHKTNTNSNKKTSSNNNLTYAINSENSQEANKNLVFSQLPFVNYIPDLAEDFIFTFMKIPEISAPLGQLANIESLSKNLCNWLFVNELSNLKLIITEKKKPGYFIGVDKKI